MLVDAIENEFVPVLIHNNKGGEDEAVLARFKEPSWNNPVVRFVDAAGSDLIPRKDRVWSQHGIVFRMIQALQAAKKSVPAYLELLLEESRPVRLETATFAMHCYWEGEAQLGVLSGVHATRAAWLEGKEVVELRFDPKRIGYGELLQVARHRDCASTVYAHGEQQLKTARELVGEEAKSAPGAAKDAKLSDRKYYLSNSELRHLPLTPLQVLRINAALGTQSDPAPWLSPSQRVLAKAIREALQKDEKALEGLHRPNDPANLAAYEASLRARLIRYTQQAPR